jgi:hypothetical protein
MIFFTPEEKQLIARLSVVGGWDNIEANELKRKIKDHFLSVAVPRCCYCQLSMGPWYRMTIDVEHVLPKKKFPQYTFDLRNLNISCKRCNMGIKREDVGFYLRPVADTNPFRSELYAFAHPNLDITSHHLQIVSVQIDAKLLIYYLKKTEKGKFTYEYFELIKIETDSFNEAQGVTDETPNDKIPQAIAQTLRNVLKTIE